MRNGRKREKISTSRANDPGEKFRRGDEESAEN